MLNSQLSVIERVSYANGYGDFHKAADRKKYEVYKLALNEIFTLLGQDPISIQILQDVMGGLTQMEIGFYDLINKSAITTIDLFNYALPVLYDAKAALKEALAAYNPKRPDRNFFRPIDDCKMKIFELMKLLSPT